MAFLHCRIRITIQILIRTANQTATLYYVELFTLHKVRFRFQSQLPSKGIGSESGLELEYGSVNVNPNLRMQRSHEREDATHSWHTPLWSSPLMWILWKSGTISSSSSVNMRSSMTGDGFSTTGLPTWTCSVSVLQDLPTTSTPTFTSRSSNEYTHAC